MGKPSDHGVTWSPFAAAAPAPLVGLDHLTGQYGTIRLESLPGDNEAEFVEAAEGSQVGAGERISAPADGSVVHVEVFRAECVGALILGRPRPLSGHRRAGPPRDVRYTLIWEEPGNLTEFEIDAYLHQALLLPQFHRDRLAEAANDILEQTAPPRASYTCEVLAGLTPAPSTDRQHDRTPQATQTGGTDPDDPQASDPRPGST